MAYLLLTHRRAFRLSPVIDHFKQSHCSRPCTDSYVNTVSSLGWQGHVCNCVVSLVRSYHELLPKGCVISVILLAIHQNSKCFVNTFHPTILIDLNDPASGL